MIKAFTTGLVLAAAGASLEAQTVPAPTGDSLSMHSAAAQVAPGTASPPADTSADLVRAGIAAFAAREWQGDRFFVDPIVVLADTIYYGGARNLAALMFDDIRRAAPDLTKLQLGRLLFRRARVAWSLGATDEADERYQAIDTLGKKTRPRNFELSALAERKNCGSKHSSTSGR